MGAGLAVPASPVEADPTIAACYRNCAFATVAECHKRLIKRFGLNKLTLDADEFAFVFEPLLESPGPIFAALEVRKKGKCSTLEALAAQYMYSHVGRTYSKAAKFEAVFRLFDRALTGALSLAELEIMLQTCATALAKWYGVDAAATERNAERELVDEAYRACFDSDAAAARAEGTKARLPLDGMKGWVQKDARLHRYLVAFKEWSPAGPPATVSRPTSPEPAAAMPVAAPVAAPVAPVAAPVAAPNVANVVAFADTGADGGGAGGAPPSAQRAEALAFLRQTSMSARTAKLQQDEARSFLINASLQASKRTLAAASSLVASAKDAFKLIDASGDGVLSAAELTAAVASDAAVKDFVGTQPELAGWLKPSKLKLVLGSIDTSGNGVIELSEWVDFFELIELARVDARASTARKGLVERAKAEVGAARAAKLRAAFEAYDTDGDGAVAAYELANVMRQMGAAVSDEECAALVARVDLDASNLLDWEEFLILCAPRALAQARQFVPAGGRPGSSSSAGVDRSLRLDDSRKFPRALHPEQKAAVAKAARNPATRSGFASTRTERPPSPSLALQTLRDATQMDATGGVLADGAAALTSVGSGRAASPANEHIALGSPVMTTTRPGGGGAEVLTFEDDDAEGGGRATMTSAAAMTARPLLLGPAEPVAKYSWGDAGLPDEVKAVDSECFETITTLQRTSDALEGLSSMLDGLNAEMLSFWDDHHHRVDDAEETAEASAIKIQKCLRGHIVRTRYGEFIDAENVDDTKAELADVRLAVTQYCFEYCVDFDNLVHQMSSIKDELASADTDLAAADQMVAARQPPPQQQQQPMVVDPSSA